MNNLLTLPGVVQVLPFTVHDDLKHKPSQCELLVHPEHGWAIATELAGGVDSTAVTLGICHHTLAAKTCHLHHIEPAYLTLFTRYTYSALHESIYVLRFSAGEKDLFNEVRFVGGRRELVHPTDFAALKKLLHAGQAPPLEWRALAAG